MSNCRKVIYYCYQYHRSSIPSYGVPSIINLNGLTHYICGKTKSGRSSPYSSYHPGRHQTSAVRTKYDLYHPNPCSVLAPSDGIIYDVGGGYRGRICMTEHYHLCYNSDNPSHMVSVNICTDCRMNYKNQIHRDNRVGTYQVWRHLSDPEIIKNNWSRPDNCVMLILQYGNTVCRMFYQIQIRISSTAKEETRGLTPTLEDRTCLCWDMPGTTTGSGSMRRNFGLAILHQEQHLIFGDPKHRILTPVIVPGMCTETHSICVSPPRPFPFSTFKVYTQTKYAPQTRLYEICCTVLNIVCKGYALGAKICPDRLVDQAVNSLHVVIVYNGINDVSYHSYLDGTDRRRCQAFEWNDHKPKAYKDIISTHKFRNKRQYLLLVVTSLYNCNKMKVNVISIRILAACLFHYLQNTRDEAAGAMYRRISRMLGCTIRYWTKQFAPTMLASTHNRTSAHLRDATKYSGHCWQLGCALVTVLRRSPFIRGRTMCQVIYGSYGECTPHGIARPWLMTLGSYVTGLSSILNTVLTLVYRVILRGYIYMLVYLCFCTSRVHISLCQLDRETYVLPHLCELKIDGSILYKCCCEGIILTTGYEKLSYNIDTPYSTSCPLSLHACRPLWIYKGLLLERQRILGIDTEDKRASQGMWHSCFKWTLDSRKQAV